MVKVAPTDTPQPQLLNQNSESLIRTHINFLYLCASPLRRFEAMSAMRDKEMSDITGDVSDSLERSSDHSATAASFKRRKLRFKMAQKTNTGTAATVQTRVDSFAGTHLGDPPTKQQTTQETLAKSLLTALMTPTKGEVQYDKLLFDAWKAWLPTISTASSKECIVLQYHRDPDSAPTSEPLMATCLTRQLTQDDLPFLKKSSNVGVATRKSANATLLYS